ncbi:RagB/SusD family nutrient uptake outer membrane protein [Pontibacter chinhatensis]|uniref:Starch-binding associating with outer membrane n=1 Tax=Pontibacter chinhatensis TaxID=1436961 RepID=A0A1I2ZL95_9BACT|nr:RagB/SusD family nutrient uptake outer membrane protein [Pontibacter chinhatensis]SFH38490.1 Starch-binding associating with outer membrane [Pontibacter chinhatensis]
MKTKYKIDSRFFRILFLINFVLGACMVQSCTDLDEEVYDKVPSDKFGTNPEQLNALVGPLYSSLGDYFGRYIEMNVSTDELIIPTRGGDWKDGDKWRRMHQHTWDPTQDDGIFNGVWTWVYNNVTSINQQLNNPNIAANAELKAELRALRAFYHYIAMDNFGNVIIADQLSTEALGQKSRAEVYAWIEKELVEALPDLSETVGGAKYGRMNKYVANMILAKMYLNAEVYIGTPQWSKAIAQCDMIINSGKYSLAEDFFSNFSVNNEGSPEIILATPMDKTKRSGMNIHMRTLHYRHQITYGLGVSPWNGYATLPAFYNSFEDKDIRKQMWIVGQQYAADGSPLNDDNVPMVITVDIPAFEMPAGPTARLAGARSQKYEIQRGNNYSSQDNDFVIYRLADVYLMRGEAKFRLGDTGGALEDINFIRTKRGVDAFTTLSLDAILAERGRELAWEFHRRQDLIRFGQFTKEWLYKPASAATRELFPIPSSQLALNPTLKQNPGY